MSDSLDGARSGLEYSFNARLPEAGRTKQHDGSEWPQYRRQRLKQGTEREAKKCEPVLTTLFTSQREAKARHGVIFIGE